VPKDGVSDEIVKDTKTALRGLGLDDHVKTGIEKSRRVVWRAEVCVDFKQQIMMVAKNND
jgi:hypothetical protein